MARVELTAQLREFRAVVKEMRDLGVASWTNSPVGDVVLGPPPKAEISVEEKDPKANRRSYYEGIFNRPVTDSELERLP